MKKLLGLLFTLILLGCNKSKESNKEFETESKAETKKEMSIKIDKEENVDKTKQISETERIEKVFTEFKNLYKELIGFKNDENFKKAGFGKGGNYNDWLKKVRDLKQNPDSRLLLKKGVLIGELEQLGITYAGSRGKETNVTKAFNKIFKEAISGK